MEYPLLDADYAQATRPHCRVQKDYEDQRVLDQAVVSVVRPGVVVPFGVAGVQEEACRDKHQSAMER
jgi:hypothetical protein